MTKYRNLIVAGDHYEGERNDDDHSTFKLGWYRFAGNANLMKIREAMELDGDMVVVFWLEQDGMYGAMDYDWSAIRDSSPTAKAMMEHLADQWAKLHNHTWSWLNPENIE